MISTAFAAALMLFQSAPAAKPLSAAESDPNALRLMQGSPVPADKQVRWDNGNMWVFPNTRWAFSHARELMPTIGIRRGPMVRPLPRAERGDLDEIRFTTMDGTPMSWRQSLDAN